MIHASINYLTRQLNQYLKNTLNLHDDVVVIANPADDDGKMFPLAKNKLVVFLSNIEREMLPHRSNAAPPRQPLRGDYATVICTGVDGGGGEFYRLAIRGRITGDRPCDGVPS